jgi:hypothetical protein
MSRILHQLIDIYPINAVDAEGRCELYRPFLTSAHTLIHFCPAASHDEGLLQALGAALIAAFLPQDIGEIASDDLQLKHAQVLQHVAIRCLEGPPCCANPQCQITVHLQLSVMTFLFSRKVIHETWGIHVSKARHNVS